MEYSQLAQGERYAMARMIRQGFSYRAMALVLGRLRISANVTGDFGNVTDFDR